MKKVSKLLTIICAVVLVLTALSGCGVTTTAATTAATSVAATIVAETVATESIATETALVAAATAEITTQDPAANAVPQGTPPDGGQGGQPPSGTPGEPPSGGQGGESPSGGQGGEPPSGTPGEPPSGGQGGQPPSGGGGQPGGGSTTAETGTGAYLLSNGETLEGGTYTSTNADENAIRAEGAITATLNNVSVEKTAGAASSSDASSFYGLNAAILALDSATLNITGGKVTASAEGANGVFAYNGAIITITDTIINVTGGNAGGIEVAGGGILYAYNLTVNSAIKAAIRSDRGGGTLVVDGGTYTTAGSSGAPAIYSTADITVSNATLTANDSEAVVVEGLNSVTLVDCDVTGNMDGSSAEANGENVHNVMLYQSMSGDAETGTSSFSMTGGSLVSLNGDMFYVTNTDSIITLSGVDLTLADDTYLLLVAGNSSSRGWGTAGANGGNTTFNLNAQTVTGDIQVDSISTLAMNITNSSAYTGAINADGTSAGSLSVTLDSTSTWTLTGDSYVTAFNGSMSNVVTNGYTLYVNGVAAN